MNPHTTKASPNALHDNSGHNCDGSDLEDDVLQKVDESYVSGEEEQDLEEEFFSNIGETNDL